MIILFLVLYFGTEEIHQYHRLNRRKGLLHRLSRHFYHPILIILFFVGQFTCFINAVSLSVSWCDWQAHYCLQVCSFEPFCSVIVGKLNSLNWSTFERLFSLFSFSSKDSSAVPSLSLFSSPTATRLIFRRQRTANSKRDKATQRPAHYY